MLSKLGHNIAQMSVQSEVIESGVQFIGSVSIHFHHRPQQDLDFVCLRNRQQDPDFVAHHNQQQVPGSVYRKRGKVPGSFFLDPATDDHCNMLELDRYGVRSQTMLCKYSSVSTRCRRGDHARTAGQVHDKDHNSCSLQRGHLGTAGWD